MRALLLTLCFCVGVLSIRIRTRAAANYVNFELPWHDVAVDSQNKLLAWYHPEQNLGYDNVLHLAWDFLEDKVPTDPKTGSGITLNGDH